MLLTTRRIRSARKNRQWKEGYRVQETEHIYGKSAATMWTVYWVPPIKKHSMGIEVHA